MYITVYLSQDEPNFSITSLTCSPVEDKYLKINKVSKFLVTLECDQLV